MIDEVVRRSRQKFSVEVVARLDVLENWLMLPARIRDGSAGL